MLKFSKFIVIAGLIFCAGCGGQNKTAPSEAASANPSGANTKPPTPSEEKDAFKVEIADGKLSINGVVIPSNPTVADVEKALGKSSGTSGSNATVAIEASSASKIKHQKRS